MKYLMVAASALFLMSNGLSASAARIDIDELDFSKVVENEKIVFAPLKETSRNRGVLWFKAYEKRISAPTGGVWDLRKVSAFYYPSASNDEINNFLRDNSASDARTYVLPEDARLCEPTEELETFMESLSIPYEFNIRGPRYPGICGIDIRYSLDPEKETQIVDFVSNNKIVDIAFTIHEPGLEDIVIQVPDIVQELVGQEVLELRAEGYSGDLVELVFYASRVAPELFGYDSGTELDFDRWYMFFDLFDLGVDGEVFIPFERADHNYEFSPINENPYSLTVIQ